MRVKGAFARLCVAMNQQLVPVLNSAGFSSSDTPFRRDEVRYEFRRYRSERTEVVAVLFNRKREAALLCAALHRATEGVPAFLAAGGTLHVAALSAARTWWPMGVVPFRAAPTFSTASEGIECLMWRVRFSSLPHSCRMLRTGSKIAHAHGLLWMVGSRSVGRRERLAEAGVHGPSHFLHNGQVRRLRRKAKPDQPHRWAIRTAVAPGRTLEGAISRDSTGYGRLGWYIDVESAAASYLIGASADAVDPAPTVAWVVQVHKHRSMTDKLLGRNKMAADDPLFALIERIVRGDSRIEQVSVERDA